MITDCSCFRESVSYITHSSPLIIVADFYPAFKLIRTTNQSNIPGIASYKERAMATCLNAALSQSYQEVVEGILHPHLQSDHSCEYLLDSGCCSQSILLPFHHRQHHQGRWVQVQNHTRLVALLVLLMSTMHNYGSR